MVRVVLSAEHFTVSSLEIKKCLKTEMCIMVFPEALKMSFAYALICALKSSHELFVCFEMCARIFFPFEKLFAQLPVPNWNDFCFLF